MQVKTTSVAEDLNVRTVKSKILKYNTENTNLITFGEETLENVESFKYLVNSINDEQEGTDSDVNGKIGKAKETFVQLNNIWSAKQLSVNIKARIFNINVKTA
ncbi:unnamed protein product [Schistosoma margrebowiei]|uniref:Uncharacterized protein n=1 Tax=Schistosoma margrebowiei TaxID=48269 RepID=A0A183M740_9TREM|nr:unnamed protein product [Schistosoma margrebowiei]